MIANGIDFAFTESILDALQSCFCGIDFSDRELLLLSETFRVKLYQQITFADPLTFDRVNTVNLLSDSCSYFDLFFCEENSLAFRLIKIVAAIAPAVAPAPTMKAVTVERFIFSMNV